MKIIEYSNEYAAGVADMWLNSKEGWLGEVFLTTKESVIEEEENSPRIASWIAVENQQVLGYCNLDEYRDDANALYIGLLNVRDDHHGRKIGKKLLIKVVEKTIELGWDRLDLYTWSGNTKAVPLYKKSGFFWEDRDESTHLMNFLPSVMNNQLTKSYMTDFDWYEDNSRDLAIKPDGRRENNFEYYTYKWQKKDRVLAMEFCRRGRGLRRLDTKDFSITATVEDLKLVFGCEYKIKYRITNKTNKPLRLQMSGIDDKNIKFKFEHEEKITTSKTLQARFFVDKIEKEQNNWRTHPCVVTKISVDGKSALFKIGIDPQFPAKISMKKRPGICKKNTRSLLHIDMENNFKEAAEFTFTLPRYNEIDLLQNDFNLEMQAEEKCSIPIEYILHKGFCFSPEIEITAKRKDHPPLIFRRRLNLSFHTLTDKFSGSMQEMDMLGNCTYHYHLSKSDYPNRARFGDMLSERGWLSFDVPYLGKPYSAEFNQKECDETKFVSEENAVLMITKFSSRNFKGISFRIFTKLFANGILERWFEFYSNGKTKHNNLFFKDDLRLGRIRMTLPYDNEIIETESKISGGVSNWQSSRITENWLFAEKMDSTIALCWYPEYKIRFGDWKTYFEYDLKELNLQKKIVTKPVTFAINRFDSWQKLREYALHNYEDLKRPESSLAHIINNHNPFVRKEFPILIREFKNSVKQGNIRISSQHNNFPEKVLEFTDKQEKILNTKLALDGKAEIDIVKFSNQFTAFSYPKERVIFPCSGNVKTETDRWENKKVYMVDNGCIRFAASPDFAPALFSLKYRNDEWLDSSFPKKKAKGWWNPWFGGMITIPEQMNFIAVLKEKHNFRFIKLKDNMANSWQGIEIASRLKHYEELKGLEFSQYFLTLPGVPVLCHTLKFEQECKYIPKLALETNSFVKTGEKLQEGSFRNLSKIDSEFRVNTGREMYGLSATALIEFSGEKRAEKLYVYFNPNSNAFTVTDTKTTVSWICETPSCEAGKTYWLKPKFYIFSNKMLQEDSLMDLLNIEFDR